MKKSQAWPLLQRYGIIFIADLITLGFVLYLKETMLFEVLLSSQLFIGILMLAVEKQAQVRKSVQVRWKVRAILSQIIFILGFCYFLFQGQDEWSASPEWVTSAQLLVGKSTEITTIIGLIIGTMAILGSLLLRKRGPL